MIDPATKTALSETIYYPLRTSSACRGMGDAEVMRLARKVADHIELSGLAILSLTNPAQPLVALTLHNSQREGGKMAILLVTYDLRKPGQNYQPVFDYLKKFTHCKGMESVWLLDTTVTCSEVRDSLKQKVDSNDRVFVCRLASRDWASYNYNCGDWLNKSERNW